MSEAKRQLAERYRFENSGTLSKPLLLVRIIIKFLFGDPNSKK